MDRHRRTKPTGRAALDFAADPDWRRRARLGLCPTTPLHDDATRTTACWLIAGRRDVSVARTDRKREEREMRTCRDVQSIKRERETERDGEREKISGTWWKRRWYGRRNKRKSTRSTSAARLTAAATNIFLILNNSFFLVFRSSSPHCLSVTHPCAVTSLETDAGPSNFLPKTIQQCPLDHFFLSPLLLPDRCGSIKNTSRMYRHKCGDAHSAITVLQPTHFLSFFLSSVSPGR